MYDIHPKYVQTLPSLISLACLVFYLMSRGYLKKLICGIDDQNTRYVYVSKDTRAMYLIPKLQYH